MPDFSDGSVVKNPPVNIEDSGDMGQIPGSGRSLGGDPIPVFLPEKSHGQRSLEGYRPNGCKESDMTEHIHILL